jgi:hypothetical protein
MPTAKFQDLDIREKIRVVSKQSSPDLPAQKIGERYGVTGSYIFQIRKLENLRGGDGEKILDAIDNRRLSLAKVAKELQASYGDDLRDVQKRILAMRAIERPIGRGYDPSRSPSDRRRTNSGRRKGGKLPPA